MILAPVMVSSIIAWNGLGAQERLRRNVHPITKNANGRV